MSMSKLTRNENGDSFPNVTKQKSKGTNLLPSSAGWQLETYDDYKLFLQN